MKTTFWFILIFFFVACACDKTENTPGETDKLPEKSAQLIEADNTFGLELFSRAAAIAKTNENTLVSPLSVSLALAMTYNGAQGQTKTDMEKTLKLAGLTSEQINSAYQSLVAALQSSDPDVLLEMANAIYFRQGFTVLPDFISVNQKYYNAAVNALDFGSPHAVNTINAWVAQKTKDKIPTIINQIESDLVMILLNAVYFNGIWKYKFDDQNTRNLTFRLENGTTKETPMMNQEASLEYLSNSLFSAVNLPYGKGQFQMTVILPKENKTTADVISELNMENWRTWMKSFKTEKKVEVTMPRFKFAWELKLNQLLTDMGMGSAFSSVAADFSGINKDRDLYIGYVIHKTYVDVNENGTEAAAVTAVGIFITSAPPTDLQKIYFTVDRPFLFTITEKSTGAILFIGEVTNPEYVI